MEDAKAAKAPSTHAVQFDEASLRASTGSTGSWSSQSGYASSETSNTSSLPAAALGSYSRQNQMLRLECISDRDAKRLVTWINFAMILSACVTIVFAVLKGSPRASEYFVLSRTYHVVNVCVATALVAAFGGYYARYLNRLRVCRAAHKAWSERRVLAVRNVVLRSAVVLAMLLSYLAANAYILARPGAWCDAGDVLIPIAAWLRWCGWTILLTSAVVDAHCTNLRPQGKRPDSTVLDEPTLFHWPMLLFGFAILGTVTATLVLTLVGGNDISITVIDGGPCTWGADLVCEAATGVEAASALTMAAFGVLWALFMFFSIWTWRQLHGRLYQDYRMAHLIMRLQFRMNMAGFTLIVLTAIVLWWVGDNMCIGYGLSWFGNMPMLLMMPALIAATLYTKTPRHPDEPPPRVAAILQDFAWTEAQEARKLDKREGADMCDTMRKEPLFCIETAIKTFYWAALIYDYTEAERHQFSSLPAAIREVLGEVEHAMQFYGLSKRRMFYDRTVETKVLVAWSDRTIVLSCRGSIERANFVADAKFLLTHHPPKRHYEGSHPKVHTGFLKTWCAGNINQKIVAHVRALLATADDPSAVQILLTGHSLGGAVAQLAALDIAKELKVSPARLKVYTFGCPRVGNHTFAREYEQFVPDTWHVINDQDVVTSAMKLGGMYKRAGHRVIINAHGDLIVRPTFIELSLLQTPFRSSVMHHATMSYQAAMHAVVTTQLSGTRRHPDGLEGVAELLDSAPIVREALDAATAEVGASFTDQVRGLRGLARLGFEQAGAGAALQRLRSLGGRTLRGQGIDLTALDGDISNVHAPVGNLDDPDDDDQPHAAAAADVEAGAGPAGAGAAASAAGAAPQARARRHWGLASGMLRAMGGKGASEEATAAPRADAGDAGDAGTASDRVGRRCYAIPEDGASGAPGAQGSTGEGDKREAQAGAKQCKWRCPLSCPTKDLPKNARVSGTVLEIGEEADMRTCKRASSSAWRCPKQVLAERRAARELTSATNARAHLAARHDKQTGAASEQEVAGEASPQSVPGRSAADGTEGAQSDPAAPAAALLE